MAIQWKEQYSTFTAQVGRIGKLEVHWIGTGQGYKVTVFGRVARNPPSTEEAAKAHAIELAKRALTEALAELSP